MRGLGVRTYVVWIPMLDKDEASEVPYASSHVAVSPQYFDGEKRVGDGLARSFRTADPVWDAFLFYPPGARWGEHGLPMPEAAIVQTNAVVVGTPGTLPAVADQSKLPPDFAGRAAVIGEQSNIEGILKQVSEAFVARHRR